VLRLATPGLHMKKEPQLRLLLTVNMLLNKLSVGAMKKIVKNVSWSGTKPD
jgi:hypothetical protein